MEQLKIEGLIKVISETEYSANGEFAKRNFVVETIGQFAQEIPFQLTQSRCVLLDKHSVGDRITVYFNLKGWSYLSKGVKVRAVTLNAWRLSTGQSEADAKNSIVPPAPGIAEDDLPF